MLRIIRKIQTNHQFARYIAIGISAFLIEYGSFLLLIALFSSDQLSLVVAQSLSFGAGFITSFLGNRRITFHGKAFVYVYSQKKQVFRYFVLATANLILTNILIYLFVNNVHIAPLYAKVVVMMCVVSWNYIIFQKYIFKRINKNGD